MSNELYVLVRVDKEGNITDFPKGGGSSTPPRVKSYDTLGGAKRGKAHYKGLPYVKIAKASGLEIIE